MQITHEEAHRLIQLDADEVLSMQEKVALSTHLEDCMECRAYAREIEEVESVLVPLMKRQWDLQPAPLLIGAIRAKGFSKTQISITLATRIAAIGVVFLAFVFSAWQLALSGRQAPGHLPIDIPSIPIPPMQSTSTKITSPNCHEILYRVQESDTLESLAHRFSVSPDEIRAINNMKTETIHPAMQLRISICNFTPTGTSNPTIFSTTYTPSRKPITSTPVPNG